MTYPVNVTAEEIAKELKKKLSPFIDDFVDEVVKDKLSCNWTSNREIIGLLQDLFPNEEEEIGDFDNPIEVLENIIMGRAEEEK